MHLAEGVKLIWNGVLDVVYPPRCLVCGRDETEPFCTICQGEIVPLNPPFCDRCGVPVATGRLVCPQCEAGPEPFFAWSRAVGQYTGVLRTALQRLKYESKGALARPLGEMLVRALERDSPLLPSCQQFDLVVPVPLHPSRFRARGFNQAERLARAPAQHLGLPLDTEGLLRVRKTRTQTALHATERHTNVKGVFDTKTSLYFNGKSVLLIDDVLTTCSTSNKYARLMRKAGAGAGV